AACAPESAHLARLDGRQQLHLQGVGKLADLVEEERALMRGLDQPSLGNPRVGEGSTLEPEQLRLEQCLGNRGAVDVDERPGGPSSSGGGVPRRVPFPCRSRRATARTASGHAPSFEPAAASAFSGCRAQRYVRSARRAQGEWSFAPAFAATARRLLSERRRSPNPANSVAPAPVTPRDFGSLV